MPCQARSAPLPATGTPRISAATGPGPRCRAVQPRERGSRSRRGPCSTSPTTATRPAPGRPCDRHHHHRRGQRDRQGVAYDPNLTGLQVGPTRLVALALDAQGNTYFPAFFTDKGQMVMRIWGPVRQPDHSRPVGQLLRTGRAGNGLGHTDRRGAGDRPDDRRPADRFQRRQGLPNCRGGRARRSVIRGGGSGWRGRI